MDRSQNQSGNRSEGRSFSQLGNESSPKLTSSQASIPAGYYQQTTASSHNLTQQRSSQAPPSTNRIGSVSHGGAPYIPPRQQPIGSSNPNIFNSQQHPSTSRSTKSLHSPLSSSSPILHTDDLPRNGTSHSVQSIGGITRPVSMNATQPQTSSPLKGHPSAASFLSATGEEGSVDSLAFSYENMLQKEAEARLFLEEKCRSLEGRVQELESRLSGAGQEKQQLTDQISFMRKDEKVLHQLHQDFSRLKVENEQLKAGTSDTVKRSDKGPSNAELLKRIADLEKELADVKSQKGSLQMSTYLNDEKVVDLLTQMPSFGYHSWTQNSIRVTTDSKLPPPLPVPRNVDAELWTRFTFADPYQTRKLDAAQLCYALGDLDWPPISVRTGLSLIRLFDRSGDFIVFEQFERIWDHMLELKDVFLSFEGTKVSDYEWGLIPTKEMPDALKQCDVIISTKVLELNLKRVSVPGGFTWDAFVAYVTSLKLWTLEFQKYDTDNDRAVTLLFNQFVDIVNRCSTI